MARSLRISLPKFSEAAVCIIALAMWLGVTAAHIGFRGEHAVLAVVLGALFFATDSSRRLVVAILPFFVFGISYDWMNLLPNYEVNPVDTEGLYLTEKQLFGIAYGSTILTPNEFFALHTSKLADFMAGIFYLCWVPLPIIFGLWLYFTKRYKAYIHFSLVFLFVNLIGFAVYYIHPAAPPWYVAEYGYDAIPGTPGSVAGLGRFDEMTGLGVFNGLYARNANVFAAMPSLHSAYTFVAFIYSMKYRCNGIWRWVLGIVTVGIWWTAVYSSHHYILDVLGGILCSFAGFIIFESVFMRISFFRTFINRYENYINPPENG